MSKSSTPHPIYWTHSPYNYSNVIRTALRSYRRITKNDLISHRLTARFQRYDSPATILAVLQEQAGQLDRSRGSEESLVKLLDQTVIVLYTFSQMLEDCTSGVNVL